MFNKVTSRKYQGMIEVQCHENYDKFMDSVILMSWIAVKSYRLRVSLYMFMVKLQNVVKHSLVGNFMLFDRIKGWSPTFNGHLASPITIYIQSSDPQN